MMRCREPANLDSFPPVGLTRSRPDPRPSAAPIPPLEGRSAYGHRKRDLQHRSSKAHSDAGCLADASASRRAHCLDPASPCSPQSRCERRAYRCYVVGRCPFRRPDGAKRLGRTIARFPDDHADAADGKRHHGRSRRGGHCKGHRLWPSCGCLCTGHSRNYHRGGAWPRSSPQFC